MVDVVCLWEAVDEEEGRTGGGEVVDAVDCDFWRGGSLNLEGCEVFEHFGEVLGV